MSVAPTLGFKPPTPAPHVAAGQRFCHWYKQQGLAPAHLQLVPNHVPASVTQHTATEAPATLAPAVHTNSWTPGSVLTKTIANTVNPWLRSFSERAGLASHMLATGAATMHNAFAGVTDRMVEAYHASPNLFMGTGLGLLGTIFSWQGARFGERWKARFAQYPETLREKIGKALVPNNPAVPLMAGFLVHAGANMLMGDNAVVRSEARQDFIAGTSYMAIVQYAEAMAEQKKAEFADKVTLSRREKAELAFWALLGITASAACVGDDVGPTMLLGAHLGFFE